MKVIKPPTPFPYRKVKSFPRPWLFLAGSIEMGAAEDWQTTVENYFLNTTGTILNPRRDSWDSSWKQSIDEPNFNEQVHWELDGLDHADLVLMYFDPNTKSPISLLELGLHASDEKMIVCCPKEFWRKGNVDIVCERFGVSVYTLLDDMLKAASDDIYDMEVDGVFK